MYDIPDAPYISRACFFGTDYMGEWYGFTSVEDEELDEEWDEEYEYPTDEEMEEMMETCEADEIARMHRV